MNCSKTFQSLFIYCKLMFLQVSRLVKIPGIVVSASGIKSKATRISLQCRTCRNVIPNISIKPGLEGYALPRKCNTEQVNNKTLIFLILLQDKKSFMIVGTLMWETLFLLFFKNLHQFIFFVLNFISLLYISSQYN